MNIEKNRAEEGPFARHARDGFIRTTCQCHFLLCVVVAEALNHDGIPGGAAGAVPGLPPGRGTFALRVAVLMVDAMTAAHVLLVATPKHRGDLGRWMCQVFGLGLCPLAQDYRG